MIRQNSKQREVNNGQVKLSESPFFSEKRNLKAELDIVCFFGLSRKLAYWSLFILKFDHVTTANCNKRKFFLAKAIFNKLLISTYVLVLKYQDSIDGLNTRQAQFETVPVKQQLGSVINH